MTCITCWRSRQSHGSTNQLSPPRSPERIHSKVCEQQSEAGGQEHFSCRSGTKGSAVILSHRSSCAHDSQNQKQQTRYLKPQHMQHTSDAPQRNRSGAVERPDPAVLAGLSSSNAHESAPLSAEI